jgi:hypothetical protein
MAFLGAVLKAKAAALAKNLLSVYPNTAEQIEIHAVIFYYPAE